MLAAYSWIVVAGLLIGMQYLRTLTLLVFLLQLLSTCCSLTYDPADYLEVYPDPTDPQVLRGRRPLYFALIQAFGGGFDGSGSVAGVKVALDWINNEENLLPGYTLHYTLTDSQCDRTTALNTLFYQILNEPRKLVVVGAGCSVATEPTAEVSHFYNISQLSCVSSSTELRNRLRFPRYFQLLPTEESLALGHYGIIKKFGWRKVQLLVQNENLFTVMIDRLVELLDRDDISYDKQRFNTEDSIAGLGTELFNTEFRIFVLAMYSGHARALFCEAYKSGIVLPRYVLLTPGWYVDSWWKVEGEGLNCTADERESVLTSTLAPLNTFFLDENTHANLSTTIGIAGAEFISETKQYLDTPPLNLMFSEYAIYCHDAVWSFVYALNHTLTDIADPELNARLAEAYNVTPPFTLEDFTYSNRGLLDVIFGHLANTSFDGISESVRFGSQGIRNINDIIIYQYRNMTDVAIGSTFLEREQVATVVSAPMDQYNFKYDDNEGNHTVWPEGLVPYDGVPEIVIVTIHPAMTVIYMVLACAGIILTIVCIVFNFTYRNSKLIKLASPKLNYLIGLGAIILYLDIIFSVIPTTDPDLVRVFCNLTPWLTAIGYSLCYGTILVKMARVYYIFNNPTTRKKVFQDWKLLLGVAFLIGIDLIILVGYTLPQGLSNELGPRLAENAENRRDITGEFGIITDYYVYICDSVPRDIFLGILYGYKMALQIIALVLAFSIRKVKIKGLNDAKYVAVAIYVTSIVLAVIIVATYSLKNSINGFAALFCTGFLVGTTVILLLVFVPLMVGIQKDPDGDTVFKSSDALASMSAQIPSSSSDALVTQQLKNRIKELEAELDAMKKQRSATKEAQIFKRDRTFSKTIWDHREELQEQLVELEGTV